MNGRDNRPLRQSDLASVRQQVAVQRVQAASAASVQSEMVLETLLNPGFVTPVNLTISPDGDGGIILEVPPSVGGGSDNSYFPGGW